jgi:metallo-beta-lactamase family protein
MPRNITLIIGHPDPAPQRFGRVLAASDTRDAIHRLKARKAIPDLPVFLNSPMAMNATELYRRYASSHRLDAARCRGRCSAATIVNSVEESQALNDLKMPAVNIAASGMATGRRVLHHLIAYASDPRNSIVLAGHQAGSTRGAAIAAGADEIKIFGRKVPILAEVHQINGDSAHADANEVIAWLKGFEKPPHRVFITHRETEAADTLCKRIADGLHWDAHVPDHLETVPLDVGGAGKTA